MCVCVCVMCTFTCSPDGYLYDKEAILESFLHQKRESELLNTMYGHVCLMEPTKLHIRTHYAAIYMQGVNFPEMTLYVL